MHAKFTSSSYLKILLLFRPHQCYYLVKGATRLKNLWGFHLHTNVPTITQCVSALLISEQALHSLTNDESSNKDKLFNLTNGVSTLQPSLLLFKL